MAKPGVPRDAVDGSRANRFPYLMESLSVPGGAQADVGGQAVHLPYRRLSHERHRTLP
jgi:hypothetical protein